MKKIASFVFVASLFACAAALNSPTDVRAASDLITVVHTDGTSTGYNATTTGEVGNGVALAYAVSNARNGDLFYVGAGSFYLPGDGIIDETIGGTGSFSMHGAGKYDTIIKGANTPVANIVVVAATNSETTDMTIIVTSTTCCYGAWGSDNTVANAHNALLKNAVLIGFTDGVYSNNSDSSLIVKNSDIFSNWDAIAQYANNSLGGYTTSVTVYNSTVTVVATSTVQSGIYARPVIVTGGTVNLFNVELYAKDAADTSAVEANNAYSTVNFYRGVASTTAGGWAFNQGSNAHFNATPSVIYDHSRVNGTVVSMSAIAPILEPLASSTPSMYGATLFATLLTDGGATSTIQGFEYGTSTAYGSTASSSASLIFGDFSQAISDLNCSSTYHYRAFAINPIGTATTSDQTFVTAACPVIIPSPSPTPEPVSHSSGGSVSVAALSTILAPGTTTTAYLRARGFGVATSTAAPGAALIASASTTLFARDLSIGMGGDDVKMLQRYLNAHGAVVAATGPGSPSNETAFFGAATKRAVARFQMAHGIQPAIGYFGPITRGVVNDKSGN